VTLSPPIQRQDVLRPIRPIVGVPDQTRCTASLDPAICKPKVGSSILSTGTTKTIWNAAFLQVSAGGKVGINGEHERSRQPQKQDHLFLLRSLTPCRSQEPISKSQLRFAM
jgi:hypothetical protein